MVIVESMQKARDMGSILHSAILLEHKLSNYAAAQDAYCEISSFDTNLTYRWLDILCHRTGGVAMEVPGKTRWYELCHDKPTNSQYRASIYKCLKDEILPKQLASWNDPTSAYCVNTDPSITCCILGTWDPFTSQNASVCRSYLEQAIRLDPQYCEAYNQLGILLMDFYPQDSAIAISHFERVLWINPNHVRARNHLKRL